MKNKEKYIERLIEIAITGEGLALINGEPVICSDTDCKDCDCGDNFSECQTRIREWIEAEYIEHKTFTQDEIGFLKMLPEEYKYIARDGDGRLFMYDKKPYKVSGEWMETREFCEVFCRDDAFQCIKLGDEQPTSIADSIQGAMNYEKQGKHSTNS